MTLSFPTLLWVQPVGLWRQRKACEVAIRLGMGLCVSSEALEEANPGIDEHGYTLWHYAAHASNPLLGLQALARTSWTNRRQLRSAQGEHVCHCLALHGQSEALVWWQTFAKTGTPTQSEETPQDLQDLVAPTHDGDTLLHRAAWSGDLPTIRQALHYMDADTISLQDAHGYTALVIAIHRCLPEHRKDTVQALVKAGCDPSIADQQGRNALHHGALYNDTEILILMEQAGGDSEQPDHHGLTAYDLLRQRREQSEHSHASLREHWRRRHQAKAWF